MKKNLIFFTTIPNRPSPSLKQTQLAVPGVPGALPADAVDEVTGPERCSNREDYVSTGSLAGSIASTSSGFGSLPKKRPALFNSGIIQPAALFSLRNAERGNRVCNKGNRVECAFDIYESKSIRYNCEKSSIIFIETCTSLEFPERK